MAHWLVLHSLKSFSEHPDMIGVVSGKDRADPIYAPFSKISKGDEVVYYAIRDCVIVGIFKVSSEMQYVDDPKWGPSCVYKIVPETLPQNKKVLDFKHLLRDTKVRLDLLPSRINWQRYLRGHASRPLSERDYEIVRKRILKGPGLIPFPEIRP